MTDKSDTPRCDEQVHDGGTWPRFHQCTRPVHKDGKCKIHHPDAVAARREKSDKKWQAKMEKANAPYRKIRDLERANAELREAIEQAPHDSDCIGWAQQYVARNWLHDGKCNCWKAAALRGEGK